MPLFVAFATARTALPGPQPLKQFGGVLDQLHAVLIAAGLDRRDVRRLAIEMNEDESLGYLAGFDLLFDNGAGEGRIHVPALFFRIDEDGFGSEISNGRGGSDEGERRAQDFVAWTESENFRKAHSQASAPKGTYQGHPDLETFEQVV